MFYGRRFSQLEAEVARIKSINQQQTEDIRRTQKHQYILLAAISLTMTFTVSMTSLESDDRKFLYDAIRFLVGATGIASGVQALNMENGSVRKLIANHK